MKIHGNTAGLSPSQLKALERIYRRKVPADQLTTQELTRSLCEISFGTRRQVGVLVNRLGIVDHVIIGDASKLYLPDIGRLRASEGRLRGIRLLHTHLSNEPLTHDDIVDLTRLRLDLIAAFCLNHEGRPQWVYYGHNVPVAPKSESEPYRTVGPLPYSKLDVDPQALVRALEEEFARVAQKTTAKDGRAVLVHVCEKHQAAYARDSLVELRELARTAGVEVADEVLQTRDRIDPKYVLGKGKLEDLIIRAMQLDVEVLIFDRNLWPTQAASIAKLTDLKVLDRTQLILDIFAQNAHSNDGKLQVELAQMKYLLPRLGVKDDALSRLTGGIGGRGPGETKLEIGKRRARERIARLSRQLKQLTKQRQQRRSKRRRQGVPVVAIIGYTNAGKSTLLNSLTDSNVVAEDKLFATLDPRSRRLRLPSGTTVIATDTVGFIRDLPKDLFAAFRATFEEAADADLLLHVVDASDGALDAKIEATEKLIEELGLADIPSILLFNKIDLIEKGEGTALADARGGIATSAVQASNLHYLRRTIDAKLNSTIGHQAAKS
ncbi:MAG: GTPase HflX [Myxococcota bacterium]